MYYLHLKIMKIITLANISCMLTIHSPGAVLNITHTISFSPHNTLQGRYCYYYHTLFVRKLKLRDSLICYVNLTFYLAAVLIPLRPLQ